MLYRLLALWHRVTAVVRRRRLDRDLDEELDFHLAMREADLAARAGPAADARHLATRRFGNRTLVKEELRAMWTFPTAESVWHDVRYALRTLRRTPTFTLVAVSTLALGIGGTTAIFSLGQAASVESLPYPEPRRLVQLWGTVVRDRTERRGASYPDFIDWRAQSQSFDGMAVFDSTMVTLALTGAERVAVETVSANYFDVVGIVPSLGRTFRPEEDGREAARVAIMSDGLWRRSFGADPRILGSPVVLEGRPVTIVGVAPPGFSGLTDQAQLWVPFEAVQSPRTLENRGTRGFVAVARLRPDATVASAQRELDAISARLEQAYPDTNEKRAVEVSPLAVEVFGELRPAVRALTAAVLLVLLIACANVANLLLARAATRHREIAVRAAIGASRARLLRQLLTESLVLTLLGAAGGLAIAYATVRLLVATSPVTLPSFAQPAVDAQAAAFAILLATGCGILLGLAPAAHARVTRLTDALKSAARGTATGARGARSVLVVAEVSLALVLLVSASLLIRSVSNLTRIDPGFDVRSVLTLRVSLPADPSAADDRVDAAANRRVLDRVRAVPGVVAASLASDLPLEGNSSAVFYAAEGQGVVTTENRPRAYVHRVTPEFFETMGIPLLAGRSFAEHEIIPDTPAIIVTERLVRRFWPGQDPIGRRIKLGDLGSPGPWREIIGVVPDLKYRGLPDNPTADPDLFFPMLSSRQVALVVRTSLPTAGVAGALRAAVQELNPAIPVYNVTTLAELVSDQTAQSRFTMWLMGTFAALALLLSAVGIFGVMSYLVTQRTREIGIRLALGATHRAVVAQVAGDGARLVAIGVALGIVGAVAARQALAAQLFAVGALDSAAVAAVVVIGAVALAACVIPAVRASRVDPMLAVRAE